MVATGGNTVMPDKPSRNKNHDFKQQGPHRGFATVEPDAFHHKTYHLEPRWSMLVHALQRHGLSVAHQRPLNILNHSDNTSTHTTSKLIIMTKIRTETTFAVETQLCNQRLAKHEKTSIQCQARQLESLSRSSDRT